MLAIVDYIGDIKRQLFVLSPTDRFRFKSIFQFPKSCWILIFMNVFFVIMEQFLFFILTEFDLFDFLLIFSN